MTTTPSHPRRAVVEEGVELLPPGTRHGLDRRRQVDLARVLTVAKWTDARFLDPLVGLVLPGVGDVLGATAGLYIVAMGVRHGVPRTVLARMLMNLAVDCLGGVVPVAGDLFDALNRANLRNARLLERHLAGTPAPVEAGGAEGAGGQRSLVLPIALLVAALAVAGGLAYAALRAWWR